MAKSRPPNEELLTALAQVVDDDFIAWPSDEVARVAYRRWSSFGRRNKSKTPTRKQRVNDLIKGLQAHFEPDVPYTADGDWLALAEPLADVLNDFG